MNSTRSARIPNISRIFLLWALVLGVLGAGSFPANAAPGDRALAQLERTDRILENARTLVSESSSERSREVLRLAENLQAGAWDQFRSGRFVIAAAKTLEARGLAIRAANLAREDTGLRHRALREIESAEAMLQDAVQDLSEGGQDLGRSLLDEARLQIERARTQLGQQHENAALKLALSAQRLVRQSLGAGGDRARPEILERQLSRTDVVLDRARNSVLESGDESARSLLDRAQSLQESARSAANEREVALGLARTREARHLASRALRQVVGPVTEERVRDEIARTDEILEQLREDLANSSDGMGESLLEIAERHQDRARELLQRGDSRDSLAQTLVARRLASRAQGRGPGNSP